MNNNTQRDATQLDTTVENTGIHNKTPQHTTHNPTRYDTPTRRNNSRQHTTRHSRVRHNPTKHDTNSNDGKQRQTKRRGSALEVFNLSTPGEGDTWKLVVVKKMGPYCRLFMGQKQARPIRKPKGKQPSGGVPRLQHTSCWVKTSSKGSFGEGVGGPKAGVQKQPCPASVHFATLTTKTYPKTERLKRPLFSEPLCGLLIVAQDDRTQHSEVPFWGWCPFNHHAAKFPDVTAMDPAPQPKISIHRGAGLRRFQQLVDIEVLRRPNTSRRIRPFVFLLGASKLKLSCNRPPGAGKKKHWVLVKKKRSPTGINSNPCKPSGP